MMIQLSTIMKKIGFLSASIFDEPYYLRNLNKPLRPRLYKQRFVS